MHRKNRTKLNGPCGVGHSKMSNYWSSLLCPMRGLLRVAYQTSKFADLCGVREGSVEMGGAGIDLLRGGSRGVEDNDGNSE